MSCHFLCPDVLEIPGVAMLYWDYVLSVYVGVAQNVFSGLKLWTKGKVAHIIRLTREAKQ